MMWALKLLSGLDSLVGSGILNKDRENEPPRHDQTSIETQTQNRSRYPKLQPVIHRFHSHFTAPLLLVVILDVYQMFTRCREEDSFHDLLACQGVGMAWLVSFCIGSGPHSKYPVESLLVERGELSEQSNPQLLKSQSQGFRIRGELEELEGKDVRLKCTYTVDKSISKGISHKT